ncbi:MAG TPA: alpha-glucan family phosphorylase, partial [Bacteroidetes bacterium]|nr:alpha-glucan family phosphorylase [Bacteroidota bacterium]
MNKKNTTVFEVSWEVCNKVGGIHTVISTKSKSLLDKYGNVIMIGPDLAKEGENIEFAEDKLLYEAWRMQAEKSGLKIRVGRWKIHSRPIVVLVDFTSFFKDKDDIFAHFWEKYNLDSLRGGWDYIEPVMFGVAAGKVIESFYTYNLLQYETAIAHFHEWMTGSGILYLKENLPQIGTVFTTHATILGRTIAGNHLPLYSKMMEYNPQVMANNYNISAKYSLEKLSAEHADIFTTVSSITAKECKYFLGKKPDIITPNGFEDSIVPIQNEFNIKKQLSKNKLREVSEAVLGYELDENPFFVLNSGRYEFKNKGIDIFIKSLVKLNSLNPEREIVAFIAVPAGTKGANPIVKARLEGNRMEGDDGKSFFCTHELYDIQNDPVVSLLKELNVNNSKESKIKIIFSPVYLNGSDGIFNLKYYDFLIGFHFTIFPSYYEPWGYTPMESVAFHVPTVTTSLAGFGDWIKDKLKIYKDGAYVLERNDTNDDEVIDNLTEIINEFSSLNVEEFMMSCIKAKELSKLALWNHLIKHYVDAYNQAGEKAEE